MIESVIWGISIYTDPQDYKGCICEYSEIWPMSYEVSLWCPWKVVETGGVPWWLGKGKCYNHLQKELKLYQQIKGRSTSLLFLEKSWSESCCKPFLDKWRRKWWMKISNIDVKHVGHALASWIALNLFNKFTNDLEEKDPQVCSWFQTGRWGQCALW